MTWRRSERRLLDAGKRVEARASANRERMLGSLSTASALALTSASVKAAISLEINAALASISGVALSTSGLSTSGVSASGLSALGVSALVGGTAGAAMGLALDIPPAAAVNGDGDAVSSEAAWSPGSPPGGRNAVPSGPDPLAGRDLAPDEKVLPPLFEAANSPSDAVVDPAASRRQRSTFTSPSLSDADDAPDADRSADDAQLSAAPSPAKETTEREQRLAIAALDAARVAVKAHNVPAAERSLAEYDRHRGDGTLDPEAAILRLQSLSLRGQRAEAAALAAQWLKAQPHSPYANSLRVLIAENQP